MEEFIEELKSLARKRGFFPIILDPEFEDKPEEFLKAPEKERIKDEEYKRTVVKKVVLDHLHRKIRVADITFIFNKDGYAGVNTIGEIFAADALDKYICALEDKILHGNYPDDLYEEASAQALIHKAIKTPKDLLDLLLS